MNFSLRTTYLLVLCFLTIAANADEERRFKVINAANNLADNSAQVVVCTKTGRMIISTIGNLNFFDGNSFSHVETRQQYQYQLPMYSGNYHLYFDRRHHIWLKNTYDVTCVDLLLEQFIENVDSVMRNDLGCQDLIQDLFVDHDGYVWLLTEKGLYSVENKQYYPVLKDLNLQDVDVYDNRILLTFYDNGEEVAQDIETRRIVHRTKAYEWDDAETYTKSSVLLFHNDCFYQIRNGKRKSILLCFDMKTTKWSVIARMDYHMNNMAKEKDSDVLYIPSEYGYWTYDIKTKELRQQERLTLLSGQSLLTDCNALAFDKQGGMWIGTEKRGLLYARPQSNLFRAYTWDEPEATEYAKKMDNLTQNITEFNGKRTNCMFTDSRNWTWFGTTKGLYMYRTPKSTPVIFTKSEGLLNEVVHSIVEDKDHNIWISTSFGITCIIFDGEIPVFVNSFNQQDNVPNESFINCKAMLLDDGTIIMQSIDHVIAFNPDDFHLINGYSDPLVLNPKLIKLMVNGHFVKPGATADGNTIIERAVSRIHEISLNSDQNNVSLTFSGLNYFRPLQTYYRVRVTGKGISNEWKTYSHANSDGFVDINGMLHLPLLNLLPGEYLVEVQASMLPNSWPGEVVSWSVYVNQPWWQTTGVYMFLLLVVVILLSVNFYFYSRNMKMRARRITEEGDIVRKILSFVERCDSLSDEMLAPLDEELYGDVTENQSRLTPEFIQVMIKITPFVQQHKTGELSMNMLGKAAGIDVAKLYDIVSVNLYKSPLELVRLVRLQQGAEMLRTTNDSIEAISDKCGFYTPNYFIGNFFHHYKVTPKEYREEHQ